MASAATIQARIDAIETLMAQSAGIKQQSFSDQSTTFDYESAQKELARLRNELALATGSVGGSRTRFAATSKGF